MTDATGKRPSSAPAELRLDVTHYRPAGGTHACYRPTHAWCPPSKARSDIRKVSCPACLAIIAAYCSDVLAAWERANRE